MIEAGKWYRNSKWSSKKDFCKATGKIAGDGIYYSEKIDTGRFSKESSYWGYRDTCVEASYKEYSKYLPDGHPDKKEESVDNVVELTNFPSEGYCETTDERLIKYLNNRPHSLGGKHKKPESIGVSWNPTSHWFVVGTSNKSHYKLRELEKFFTVEILDDKPKEWATGTYLVFIKEGYMGTKYNLTHLPKTTIGKVHKISFYREGESITGVDGIDFVFEKGLAKWFATKEEAETFAKTLNTEKMSDKFKRGDYIVTLDVTSVVINCGKNNYCFKQREDEYYIQPVCDLKGSKDNGHSVLTFDKSEDLKDWRYATKDEICIYNELQKPFDVTTLPKVGDYITVEENDDNTKKVICKYSDKEDALRCKGPRLSNFDSDKFIFNSTDGICFIGDDRTFRPSTDEEIAWLDACIIQGKVVILIDFKTCAGTIVKALRNDPVSIPLKAGDYAILKGDNNISTIGDDTEWSINKKTFYSDFEVMPEGFTLPNNKNKYTVVECKSQAEWDFVSKKLGYIWYEKEFDYNGNNCINIERKSRYSYGFYKECNSVIYTFEGWCDVFKHTFDKFEGVEYVELTSNSFGYKIGDIAKIIKRDDNFEVFVPNRVSSSSYTPNVLYGKSSIKPSTKEAYHKQHGVTLDSSAGKIGFDASGSMSSSKETAKSDDFNIGDWVTFEVDKCVGNLDYCRTEAWDRDMTLLIEKFDGLYPSFSQEQMQKRYPHYNWVSTDSTVTTAANHRSLFRHAYPWEIPTEGPSTGSLSKEIPISYNPCVEIKLPPIESLSSRVREGMAKFNTTTKYPVFIEKTPTTVAVVEKPITLIKTRKLQINLVD